MAAVARNRRLLAAQAAYSLFAVVEQAVWVAVLLWAYGAGGTGLAGLVAVVQLVPAAVLAPIGGVLGDRMRRDRALVLVYGLQAVAIAAVAVLVHASAPDWSVVVAAAAATIFIGWVRPPHYALTAELSATPAEAAAANSLSGTRGGAGRVRRTGAGRCRHRRPVRRRRGGGLRGTEPGRRAPGRDGAAQPPRAAPGGARSPRCPVDRGPAGRRAVGRRRRRHRGGRPRERRRMRGARRDGATAPRGGGGAACSSASSSSSSARWRCSASRSPRSSWTQGRRRRDCSSGRSAPAPWSAPRPPWCCPAGPGSVRPWSAACCSVGCRCSPCR